MNVVFEVSIPIFGIGLLGYFATRLGYFSRDNAEGLARFVYNFAVPLLLFRTLANADQVGAAHIDDGPWRLVLGYYAPMAIFYFLGMLVSRFAFKRDFGAQVITGFSFSYGNAILLGLPLALLTFGEKGAFPFFILLAFHALAAFTVTTIALEYGRSADLSIKTKLVNMAKGIATNPIIIGIIAGAAVNRLGWAVPAPLDALAGFMQNAVTPCALFALGATLTGYGVAGRLTQTSVIILAKCVAFPLVVWVSCRHVFGVDPLWAIVATLLAAQPVGVNIFIFAERYNTARAMATTAVFLSTTFSLLSIPLLLYFIDLHGLR